MNLMVPIALLTVLTAFCVAALGFVLLKPEAWSSLVDKENDFWVAKGWLSKASAEKIKRVEKGLLLKVVLGAAAGISLAVIVLALNFASHHPLRAMPPPPPSQRPAPQRPPASAPHR
jgi:hypothetical protein